MTFFYCLMLSFQQVSKLCNSLSKKCSHLHCALQIFLQNIYHNTSSLDQELLHKQTSCLHSIQAVHVCFSFLYRLPYLNSGSSFNSLFLFSAFQLSLGLHKHKLNWYWPSWNFNHFSSSKDIVTLISTCLCSACLLLVLFGKPFKQFLKKWYALWRIAFKAAFKSSWLLCHVCCHHPLSSIYWLVCYTFH